MTERHPPRFFVPPTDEDGAPLEAGRRLALPPTEAHHAAHVLRLRPGDAVEMFDGRGRTADGLIDEVRRDGVTVRVEAVHPRAAPAAPAIRLAFAVPKGKRLDWLLEKATELGAARLAPVRFARSVAGREALSPAARRRWSARCIAAAKQARRPDLPTIEPVRALADALPPDGAGVFGDTGAAARPVADVLAAMPPPPGVRSLHIYVGPEGGLADAERTALAAAGVAGVRLGPAVLRIETAAVALLAAAVAWRDEAAAGDMAGKW